MARRLNFEGHLFGVLGYFAGRGLSFVPIDRSLDVVNRAMRCGSKGAQTKN